MVRGRVKWFNEAKGFGFLENLEGQDVYVHYTAIETPHSKLLHQGQDVEFELLNTERGLEAHRVSVVDTRNCYF